MINETDGIDNRDADTWRDGEKVEAVLITTRGPGTLIRIGHPDGPFYVDASKFESVLALTKAEPDQLRSIRSLRIMLTEERLAAATARSNTTMAERKADEIADTLRQRGHELSDLRRQHRLAVAALTHFQSAILAEERSPLFEQLLGSDGKPGSVAEPCNAALTINQRYPGCGCDEPCLTEVATHPCALRRGHPFVLGKERHRTLYGQEFEAGETVLVGED